MAQYNANNFIPHPDKVFVTELERGARRTFGGIILIDDDMKNTGIRPRWGRVWKVGANIEDVKPGDWLLIEHARWAPGVDLETEEGTIRVWHIDFPEAVFLVADEDPRMATVR